MSFIDGVKVLTVKQLREVLAGIPDEYLLSPNVVRNLTVYKPLDHATHIHYAGFVDFAEKLGKWDRPT